MAGNRGVVLNADKFKFSEETVEFAWFHITKDTVEPLSKYLNAIHKYPIPKTTTDIQSWFGLVNQVSHYAQLCNYMDRSRNSLVQRQNLNGISN